MIEPTYYQEYGQELTLHLEQRHRHRIHLIQLLHGTEAIHIKVLNLHKPYQLSLKIHLQAYRTY